MNLLKVTTYNSDIDSISQKFNFYDEFKNKSLFITGCNGLICSAVVDLLIFINEERNLNLKIYLASRNVQKTIERFSVNEKKFLIPFEYDANKEFCVSEKIDYFIHGASNATPEFFGKFPVETLNANVFGIEQILKNSMKNKSRVLYISSSEVYGKLENQIEPIKENQYGFVDILNPRSCYAIGKRASETLCASYRAEYEIDFVIARPGHIYGPTASRNDNRVSSQFMYNAVDKKNIVMKSKGEQIRSYTHCLDCASAILTILVKGQNGEAYNISNLHSICSIKEMAENFAKYGNIKLDFDLPTESEKKNFNPMLNSSLNSEKLESLGWHPQFDIETGIQRTLECLK